MTNRRKREMSMRKGAYRKEVNSGTKSQRMKRRNFNAVFRNGKMIRLKDNGNHHGAGVAPENRSKGQMAAVIDGVSAAEERNTVQPLQQ